MKRHWVSVCLLHCYKGYMTHALIGCDIPGIKKKNSDRGFSFSDTYRLFNSNIEIFLHYPSEVCVNGNLLQF